MFIVNDEPVHSSYPPPIHFSIPLSFPSVPLFLYSSVLFPEKLNLKMMVIPRTKITRGILLHHSDFQWYLGVFTSKYFIFYQHMWTQLQLRFFHHFGQLSRPCIFSYNVSNQSKVTNNPSFMYGLRTSHLCPLMRWHLVPKDQLPWTKKTWHSKSWFIHRFVSKLLQNHWGHSDWSRNL